MIKLKDSKKKIDKLQQCDCCSEEVDATGLMGTMYISGKEYKYKICRKCVFKIPGFKAGKATDERKQFWKQLVEKVAKDKK